MRKIKIGDEIIVIAGKDKGKRGLVKQVFVELQRVLVEGVNLVTKHVKPNPSAGVEGGIIKQPAPLHESNVLLWNSAAGKGDRVGFKLTEDGKKVRYFKSTGEMIDL